MKDLSKIILTVGIAIMSSAAIAGGTKTQTDMKSSSSASAMQNNSYKNIVAAQKALNKEGHALLIDGKMGPNTTTAIREYQSDEGLAITGTLTSETLSSLGIASGRQPASTNEKSFEDAGPENIDNTDLPVED